MVTVQMTDENLIDALHPDPVPSQLQLGALGAIDQEKPLVMVQHLGSGISFDGRNCRIAAKYDNLKDHVFGSGFDFG